MYNHVKLLIYEAYHNNKINENEKNFLMERLETRIIHPRLPFYVNLYHGSSVGTYDKIIPNGDNIGTRLSPIRTSSFWFIKEEYAKKFSVLEVITKNRLSKFPICLDADLNVLIQESYKNEVIQILKHNNGYVYKKYNVPTKLLGVGEGKHFPEYTLDITVKPDEVIPVKFPESLKYIKICRDDYVVDYCNKYLTNKITPKYQGLNDFLFSNFVYRNTSDVLKLRKKIKQMRKKVSD